MADLLLASASPRRRELLEQIGVHFICEAQDLDESVLTGESPLAYVERLARAKAQAGAANTSLPVLGADTCVVLGAEILSKPETQAQAKSMLASLSGCEHSVFTAVAIAKQEASGMRVSSLVVETKVQFSALSNAMIDQYVATGEPMDKAGGYGIQGKAAVFVRHINGSYSNVVGLPLMETASLLQQFNVPIWGEV